MYLMLVVSLIGGVDISFFGDGISDAVAALVVLSYPDLKVGLVVSMGWCSLCFAFLPEFLVDWTWGMGANNKSDPTHPSQHHMTNNNNSRNSNINSNINSHINTETATVAKTATATSHSSCNS